MADSNRKPKSAKPRKPLTVAYQPPSTAVSELDPASKAFLAGGKTPEPAAEKTPKGRGTSYALDSEEDDGSFTALVPKWLIKWVMQAAAVRKVERRVPYTQKHIAAEALEQWLSEHHPDIRPVEAPQQTGKGRRH